MTAGPRTSHALAVLAAAVLLTHLPLLRAGYVQDDHLAVEANPVAARASAGEIVRGSYWEGASGSDRSLYRPVTIASYAIERSLAGGARPAVSHAVNLALHAAVCWLLYLLALRMSIGPGAALAAALLFAVSPSKSEAVANVVGRAEILAALFTLAALLLVFETGLGRTARDGTPTLPSPARARWAAWGCALAVLLACGSKETGILVVPLIGLAAITAPRPRPGRDWVGVLAALAPSLLALEVFVVLRARALEAFFPAQVVRPMDNPLVDLRGGAYLAAASALVVRYARIALFPFGLANDYSGPSVPIAPSWAGGRPIAGALILAASAAVVARALLPGASASARRLALFAAIALFPYLLISNLVVPVGAIVAERFLYLPVAGLCLVLAVAIDRIGRPASAGALALALALGVAMFARSLDWKDDATIFAATLRHNPASPRAAYWLGSIDAERGNLSAAAARFDDAIRLWPPYAAPRLERGLLEAKAGRLDDALRDFRDASRLEPGWGVPEIDLAVLLHRRGDLDGALRAARKAVLRDPASARSWAELGHLRFERAEWREAANAYRRAVALGRTDLSGRLNEAEGR